MVPVDDPSGAPVCVYDEAADGTACDFGSSVSGQCNDGSCQECTGPAVCNDNIACTRDLCIASACVSVDECVPTCEAGCPATLAAGCKVSGRCDGTVCTYDDAPDGKVCTLTPGTQGVCATGSCVECVSAAQCNDGVACTTDGCSNGSCVHVDGCQPSCGPDGAPCTLPTGAGVCSSGACVQCLNDSQCSDALVCTLDACAAGFCQNELKHDSVAWRLAPPLISPEILVSASHSRVVDVEWNGTDFVVFMSGGGKNARRVKTDGSVLDGPSGWTLPAGFVSAAAGGGRLLLTSSDSDPTYGGTLVKYQLYSPEGAPLGSSQSLDLDCRDPAWNCYPGEPYYGGGAFLLLYNKEWRTQYYGLVDLGGGGRPVGKVSSAQSGYTSAGHASFDGQKFVTAWHDYTRVSNSSDIGATRISPAGNDPYLSFHPLTADADQTRSNIKANVSALAGRALVLFEGPSGQGQVVDASFNAVGPRLAGFGDGSALSEPLHADHDGTNFLVVAVGASDRIVGTRVDVNGNKLDPAPFPISGADASRENFPRVVRGAGVFLVAYTKRDSPSGVYAALVTTCP